MPAKHYYLARRHSLLAANRKYYREHRAKILARHRKRNRSAAWRAYQQEYRRTHHVARSRPVAAARAHRAVRYAVEIGRLKKPMKCTNCGQRGPLHAHHHRGYRAKLDIIWLCASCHGERHRRY